MRNRILFYLSGAGLLFAIASVYLYSRVPNAQPPLYDPAANPYASGVYSEGMIESEQAHGKNINMYPEVAGPITDVPVSEGQRVHRGDVLLKIDESVQRASAEQQRAQAQAAEALLKALKAEPRPETLEVSAAQVASARAVLKGAEDALAKLQKAYDTDARSISKDALDNARNARQVAAAGLEVALRQYELTKAGAWRYDIENQERTATALAKAAAAAEALLAKYTLRAPEDGVILQVASGRGSYVSPQGAYDTYTQGYGPVIVMARPQDKLQVRVFVDEILIHRLPNPQRMKAEMFIRGTGTHLPLTFVGIQPYVTPKIELSDARQERVDVRVLPVIFRFDKPANLILYPGQLVDVYVAE